MLLDTSGLLCLHYQTEPLHTQAYVAYKKATIRLTHSYIIAEYVALATARRFPRSSALATRWGSNIIKIQVSGSVRVCKGYLS